MCATWQVGGGALICSGLVICCVASLREQQEGHVEGRAGDPNGRRVLLEHPEPMGGGGEREEGGGERVN